MPALTARLQELGIALPQLSPPLASYVPAKREGNIIYVSGQLPLRGGELMLAGPMTKDRELEPAQAAMAQCFLNGLAAAGGVAKLDDIGGVLKLGAFVASAPDFFEHHKIANGASDMAQQIFGDAGKHARFAVGVAALPLGATVELEIQFTL